MLKPLPRLKNCIFNNSEVNSYSLVDGNIKNIFETGTNTVLDIRILIEPLNYSNIFENNVKSYLKSINKEMKVKVKTGHFTIIALNDFLLEFHNKISFLLNILI